MSVPKILFLCVANAARSQIAEGLGHSILRDRAWIESAGSMPAGRVSPFAIQVLRELGIDASGQRSKAIEDLPADFLRNLDFVITLCEDEICPAFLTQGRKLHWPYPDPGGMDSYRRTRDGVKARLEELAREIP